MQMDMFGDERAFLAKQRKAWGEAIRADGGYCPCCDRKGKINRYPLTQALALALRWIATHGVEKDNGFVKMGENAPAFINVSKSFSTLQHWGLVEPKTGRSGYWRATPKAWEFMLGCITLSQAVFIYNKEIYGFDEIEISYRQCFKRNFDFDLMMSSQFRWENLQGGDYE